MRWLFGWVTSLREQATGLLFRDREAAELDEELRFHLEMEAERLEREEGLGPVEARRRAAVSFGGVDRTKEEVREAQGLGWLTGWWLDVKLGLRLLVKYPVLTVVSGVAMAFALWVGAGGFEVLTQITNPELPLDEGDRVVGVRTWDAEARRWERQVLDDFVIWREELDVIEELGAFRRLEQNLITGEGRGEPVWVAEMSPVGFEVARVPPLLGRTLVEADAAPGAAPVMVIGHGVWQRRFAGDPGVVGTAVRLGGVDRTVVGVMPEGFGFPVSDNLWVPLSLDPAGYGPREGPSVQLFGRLAPGASLSDASAELTTYGERAAAALPETHERLRPEVVPYGESIMNLSRLESAGVLSINIFLVLLLVLICGNVALLLFARAATRESELAVRSALGATRRRLITQLFAEALVLGALAAAVGLAFAGQGLTWALRVAEMESRGGGLPFWFQPGLSTRTIVYAILLTLLAAAIAGVVPALKVTGSGLEGRLRQASPGGGGLKFGGIWTAVIITQVAVTVTLPAFGFLVRRDMVQIETMTVAMAEEEFLAVRLEMDRELGDDGLPTDSREAFLERVQASYTELEERLVAEPEVAGVTFAERLPRMYHPARLIELDEGEAAPLLPEWPAYRVSSARVAPDYFQVLEAPVVAGRGFRRSDAESGARVVVVNEAFVRRVMGDRNPVGRRLRQVHMEEWDEPRDITGEPWYEIIGVVPDLGASAGPDPKEAAFYHPAKAADVYPLNLAVHVRGSPEAFAPRLRAIAGAVDPALRIYDPVRIDRLSEGTLQFYRFWVFLLTLVTIITLLLSLTGIYSVMAFTVSRRTREIGIRVALGARPIEVVATIFRRPITQVGAGLLGGVAICMLLLRLIQGSQVTIGGLALVTAYGVLMVAVCALACIVPTRRALAVEPMEALRADA